MNKKFYCPVSFQDFMWIAEYYDKTSLYEFNLNNNKENNLNLINKNILTNFGIIGLGYYFYFNYAGGQFFINNYNIKFKYIDEINRIFDLSSLLFCCNKLIFYRTAESSLYDNKTLPYIIEYSFGYTMKAKFDDIVFNIENICNVPINGNPIYFITKMTCNKNINGKLQIIKNNKLFKEIAAPIITQNYGNINWLL